VAFEAGTGGVGTEAEQFSYVPFLHWKMNNKKIKSGAFSVGSIPHPLIEFDHSFSGHPES
jgi:hypothetical protein